MTTAEQLSHEADLARKRRLAKRTCGYCDEPAQEMLDWGRQRIPICAECLERLHQPGYRCAWDVERPCTECETHPVVEARILEADHVVEVTGLVRTTDAPSQSRSLVGRAISWILGR